ncbi:MAG: hypothetical protein JW885_11600 [Deltaproteobacteria bacterium]|nr:hypothetical protein [Candidatus Zymogenaceae bacterium]
MGCVIAGCICLFFGFGGGLFVAIRYLGDWMDHVVKKYHEADGKLDSVIERAAAWIKGV